MTPDEIIEIIQAWKDGKRLQWKSTQLSEWTNYTDKSCPKSFVSIEYRIRPPEKTKYYKYICKSNRISRFYETIHYYKTDDDCKKQISEDTIIQRLDNSKIEIEEDY